ncbi:unnamed protein product [Acanthoscelides obtectus]|uniref:Uncharacterized protein n=1 Tax=Acanthoscelides obtectus TaxID=200917 RepID=A0A9P0KQZ5_ACAOB|nr:unnamed protein product [Acanthoscelides obtectus]CAK1681339.1 hypothetical protein AOBTE_LOCUS33110 [Acanthoscelides obtectus]
MITKIMTTLLAAAELSNIFSVLAVLLCFFAMILYITSSWRRFCLSHKHASGSSKGTSNEHDEGSHTFYIQVTGNVQIILLWLAHSPKNKAVFNGRKRGFIGPSSI